MSGTGTELFDVLVIGGGITGCGVARDAAMRGMSVVLIERDDLASGTSGRSSRLIHGGIRYLEHGQFHLVHEAIRERQILLRIAPHLVKPLAFTWPIYKGARIGRLKLSAGLLVYDLMSMGRSPRHSVVAAKDAVTREPALRRDNLTAGAIYYDACTDDARLAIANAISARDNGAVIETHTRVVSVRRYGSDGFRAELDSREQKNEVRARVVVNATGVWSNDFGGSIGVPRRLRGSKGVHIAVDQRRVGNNGALTLISPIDARVMFCLPAGSQTIFGTTDTWTDESPETVHATDGDVDYLLRCANYYFPDAHLAASDVTSAWAGIRPLATTASGNPTAVSREHSVVVANHVVSVTGGKLTTYRAMAAEIVDVVQRELGTRVVRSPTDTTMLPGEDRDEAIAKIAGSEAALAKPLVPALRYNGASLVYGVQHELARTLSDLLIRRTHIAFDTRDHGASVAPRAADIIAPVLRWDDEVKNARVREYLADVERIFRIGAATTEP